MRRYNLFKKAIILTIASLLPALAWAGDNQGHDHAFTIWGVFINNPGYCAAAPCTEAEVFAEGNPAETDVCFITGGRVQQTGRATLAGHFAEGSNFGCIYSGLGLASAADAEIHFVAQRHGKVRKSLLTDQVTEFLGACPPKKCLDVQFAIHVATGDFETVSEIYRFRNGSQVRPMTSTLRRMDDGIKMAFDTWFNTIKDHYRPAP